MKKCSKCKQLFSFENFPKDKSKKDGLRSYCFPCNREKINEFSFKRKEKRYLQNKENKESIKEYNQKYYIKNKLIFQKNYKKYLESNPSFKIIHNTRVRINCALKNNFKSSSTEELLGCTILEYKNYLEQQFTSEMTWTNYGSYWDIDHIKACVNFDLSKIEEQKKCFHFTNTRPLSKLENQRKNKY